MFRFSIKDIMWLTVVVALAISWGGTVEAWRSERSGHQAAKASLIAERVNAAVLTRQLSDAQLRLNRITSAYIQAKHAHGKEQEDLKLAQQQELVKMKLQWEKRLRAVLAGYGAKEPSSVKRGLDEPASSGSVSTNGQRSNATIP
jgi:hypothetical protein